MYIQVMKLKYIVMNCAFKWYDDEKGEKIVPKLMFMTTIFVG